MGGKFSRNSIQPLFYYLSTNTPTKYYDHSPECFFFVFPNNFMEYFVSGENPPRAITKLPE